MSELAVLAACGVAGGLLCAVGDVLLDLKGPGNRKLGTSGNIDSNWVKMPEWRFDVSIWLAFVGAPLVACGFWSIAEQIYAVAPVQGIVYKVCTLLVATGGSSSTRASASRRFCTSASCATTMTTRSALPLPMTCLRDSTKP